MGSRHQQQLAFMCIGAVESGFMLQPAFFHSQTHDT